MKLNPIRVLIVDDDPTFGAFLQVLIRKMGDSAPCTSTWVTTGAEAVAEINRQPYDLVLLDYNLPDTDGLKLLAYFQRMAAAEQPVVIMLTGGGSEEIAVEAMKQGAKDYLTKGAFDLPSLRRAILGAMERRRLELQLVRSTEELQRKNAQMDAELAMAREIQQALLPQQYPAVPRGVASKRSAVRFCHRWIPSRVVAGDFFEIFLVSETSAGVFVCDVMGHGVRAALITALLRGLLERLMPTATDPGVFLGELNRSLKSILQRTNDFMFATAFYLVVDVAQRQIRYANAGHPAPLHLQRQRGVVTTLRNEAGSDPALGLLSDTVYATEVRPLETADALLVFTDGLFEAEGPSSEAYGLERLHQAVQERREWPVADLLDALLVEVAKYQSGDVGEGFADDVCLVGVEFVASAATAGNEAPAGGG